MASLSLGASPREALCAAGAGLIGAAAFPPLGLWPLGLVSPCLFLVLLRGRGPTDARNLGVVYGLALSLGTMYWFFGLFGPRAIALLLLMAGYWGLLATLIGVTRAQRPLARAALVALFAVAVEWLRGDAWYLRFPWFTAPHALAASPSWVAAVRWVGVYGLSFLIWFVAAWGAIGPRPAWALFLLLPAFSWLLSPVEAPDRKALLVQAEGPGAAEAVLARLPEERVDLAVLPEYAFLTSPAAVLAQSDGPAALARKVSAPVVFGAVEGNYWSGAFDNVAVVIAADGEELGTFPKQRPVPLIRDGTPGARRPVFPIGQGVLGVAICYDFDAPEVAASLVGRGATVLVAPTFDGMSWGGVQHAQHELLLRLRAVENDRWVVRVASSGRSEVVSPHGVPSAEGIAVGETGFVTVAFAHRTGSPLGGRAHVLGPAAAAGTVLFLVLWGIGRWRSPTPSTRPAPAESTASLSPSPATPPLR
jgi:apolipoprotein N-acyltransferase